MKNEYRKEASQIAKDSRWTIFRFLPLLILVFVILFALNSAGMLGKTVVERKVFENSYQRSEGLKSGLALYEAQLAEINFRINDPESSREDRRDLRAQRASLKYQIAAIKLRQ